MRQQDTLMKFDPATGEQKPYPSHADQWRDWNGRETAWLFNPWTGTRRDAGDVGSDIQGQLILPPGEPLYAAESKASLKTVESRYKDLLDRLGVQGHDGAVAEITSLRRTANLDG